MYAVGLMSGTSLDGIDTVLCEINGQGLNTKIKVIAFDSYAMDNELKKEIKLACDQKNSTVDLICSLNFKLGKVFAKCVKELCKKANFPLNQLDYIASHGQTIYHIPTASNQHMASTLQIGEAAVIAYETGVKTISNFRVMDMAAGGQGAPLVPFSEFILYGSQTENVALQNIGGIGNVTIIPKGGNIDDVYAFDTGPGNMIIDEVMNQLYNLKYDEHGQIAAMGNVNLEMLKHMLNDEYLYKAPPKTTGREVYGLQYVNQLLKQFTHVPKEDIVATVTMFTAKCIALNYEQFILPKHPLNKIILGGGGAHNKTLCKYLSELLNIEILKQEDLGYSSDAKEAIAFVILGNETLHHSYSNVKSATGASRNVILGNITPVPY